jgi:signal transduction histidine kinase
LNRIQRARWRWPLWLQILLPVSSLTVVAVAVNALFAVVWTTKLHEQDAQKRIEQMSAVLGETSFVRSAAVLDKLHQLTNSHFAVVGNGTGQIPATTLKNVDPAELTSLVHEPSVRPNDAPRRVVLGGETFLMRFSKSTRTMGDTLVVLLPEQDLARERWRAVVPPLLVGAISLLLLVRLTLLVARRFGRRIARVQEKVALVAGSNDEPIRDEWQYEDEIHDLVRSVNELGSRLRELQSQLVASERTRLLGQFAAGMAHTIRNSIAGARLAVQLHLKRSSTSSDDPSLQVALRQLTLIEQQLRGMLAIGRTHDQPPATIGANAATRDVLDLVGPVAAHARVTLSETTLPEESFLQSDPDRLRAALLNLILNAIEAAGADGRVGMTVASSQDEVTWTIEDSGQGPPPHLAEQLGQPFVTGKPNGVGLGLALARQVAEDGRGRLRWFRRGDRTCFELVLPRTISS